MICFKQFALARGTKSLFDNVSLTLNKGERIGLVGPNGSGKSTLFATLLGHIAPDVGENSIPSSWQIAHVAQDTPATDKSALDYTLDGDVALRKIEAQIAAAASAGDGLAEATAHTAFAEADGYSAPARAQALLLGLGFTLEQTNQPVKHFSGGWRMRLNLAQALMCRSDLLLLDEPTNHLDLDAIIWLEDWLRRYEGTLIIISHDREFLDAVCNVTLHIEAQQLKRYSGNYSQFETLRAQQLALQQNTYLKQQDRIAHLQSFIDRFKAKATKAKQAQSRIKALEKMERIAQVREESPFTFQFRSASSAPNPLLTFEKVSCGYMADKREAVIVNGVTLSLRKGERIGLLGANGQGKSTLIKTLAGVLPPLTGNICRGSGLQIGYFAQHQVETLHVNDSALQHLARLSPGVREQELRNFLGSFNFCGDMATTPIAPFSGGEKSRLALALILWQRPNLLLLDEPTNHLDLETREALTLALAQFDGTLILVSHDRYLLSATTDQFMLVANGRLQPFDGDLKDYRDWLLRETAAARNERKNKANNASVTTNGNSDKNQPQTKSRPNLSQLKKQIAKFEKALETLSAEKSTLDTFLADAENYQPAQQTSLKEALKRHAEVEARLAEVENEWLKLQEAIEQAQ